MAVLVERYCQILCMVYMLSASIIPFLRRVFEYPVGELHPIDDLGHQLMPVKSSPVFLARTRIRAWVASLNTMVNVASRDPQPLVWRVRWRTVANVDSIGFVVRRWPRT